MATSSYPTHKTHGISVFIYIEYVFQRDDKQYIALRVRQSVRGLAVVTPDCRSRGSGFWNLTSVNYCSSQKVPKLVRKFCNVVRWRIEHNTEFSACSHVTFNVQMYDYITGESPCLHVKCQTPSRRAGDHRGIIPGLDLYTYVLGHRTGITLDQSWRWCLYKWGFCRQQ